MKTRNIFHKKDSHQGKSIPFFLNNRDRRDELDLSSFIRDISKKLFPYSAKSHSNNIFNINGADRSKLQDILGMITYDRGYENTSLIIKAVERIGVLLLRYGKVYLEVIREKNNIYLKPFTTKNSFNLNLFLVQKIPVAEIEKYDAYFVFFKKNEFQELVIPKILGGVRNHKNNLNVISSLDYLPDFYREDISNYVFSSGFDITSYSELKNLEINKATKQWGWNLGIYESDNKTIFYGNYQILTMWWSATVLRESIIKSLNEIFKELKLDIQIEIVDLPTPDYILNLRDSYGRQEIHFKEAEELVSRIYSR